MMLERDKSFLGKYARDGDNEGFAMLRFLAHSFCSSIESFLLSICFLQFQLLSFLILKSNLRRQKLGGNSGKTIVWRREKYFSFFVAFSCRFFLLSGKTLLTLS